MVIRADFRTEGDHSGCASFSRAATPATCGTAIDVPVRKPKFSPELEFAASGVSPARMLIPGAVTSGFRISGRGPGPREENEPSLFPVSSTVRKKLLLSSTSTLSSASSSASIRLPSASPIMSAGIPIVFADGPVMTIGSPAILKTSAATAPAASAFSTLSIKSQPPRSMKATLPLTAASLMIGSQASIVVPGSPFSSVSSSSSTRTRRALIGPSILRAGVKLASSTA